MEAIEFLVILTVSCLLIVSTEAKIITADGVSDTYTLLNNEFGGTAVEVPDCKHDVKHIFQGNDGELNRQVFYFQAHVDLDDDRCIKDDRQRTEVKVYGPSSDDLKGFQGETVSLSWNFKLDANFQPSDKFTHIHQLKVDGDGSSPLITLTPRRRSSTEVLDVIYTDANKQTTVLGSASLAEFKGVWVHVTEESTYGDNGKYRITITRYGTTTPILTIPDTSLSMWRSDASFVRPKWGIYRYIKEVQNQLRDETVRFDTFCLGKGYSMCT